METEYIKTVDALNGIYNCPTKIDEDGYIWVRTIDALHKIDDIPTADVRPVVHGKWVHGREVSREYLGDCLVGIFYDRWTCSECGYIVDDHAYSRINYNFCPNCGADMVR